MKFLLCTVEKQKESESQMKFFLTRRLSISCPEGIVLCNEDHLDNYPRLSHHKRLNIPAKSTGNVSPAPQQWNGQDNNLFMFSRPKRKLGFRA